MGHKGGKGTSLLGGKGTSLLHALQYDKSNCQYSTVKLATTVIELCSLLAT